MILQLFTAKGVKPWVASTLVTLWITTVGNWTLWSTLFKLPELANVSGYLFMFAFWVAIFSLTMVVIALCTTRYTLKFVLSLLLLITAVCTYFMWSYGIVIDRSMIVNAMQTDRKESFELLNLRMLLFVCVLAVLPIIMLQRMKIVYQSGLKQLRNNIVCMVTAVLCAVIALVATFQTVSSTMRNQPHVRHMITPLNALWGTGAALFKPDVSVKAAATPIGLDAKLTRVDGALPALLVLVVGETARYDHFSLNGYTRNTNPKLLHSDVISLGQVWSCGTNTATSVPCMFSHLGQAKYSDTDVRYENVLDVLQRAGLAVIWLDNQAGCKGVCDRVPSVNTGKLDVPQYCASGECRDGVMLSILDAELAKLPAQSKRNGVVVVMHQMGSHGPAYYKRTDEVHKVFKPECVSNALNTCKTQDVINAYDNTIVATDAFLAQTINWLKTQSKQYATGMMYVSDHGESLGENNIYLHGLPYKLAPDAQKRVPWINWLSDPLATSMSIDLACLNHRKDVRASHDHYFHSVLSIMNVKTQEYKPELDIFKPCKS